VRNMIEVNDVKHYNIFDRSHLYKFQ